MAATTGEIRRTALACANGANTGGREDRRAGGAPETRHSGHSVPCSPNSTVPVSVCSNILVAPVPAQTISSARGWTMGDATATPKAKTNHAKTHTRRLKEVLAIFMGASLDSSNMNHIDTDHVMLPD